MFDSGLLARSVGWISFCASVGSVANQVVSDRKRIHGRMEQKVTCIEQVFDDGLAHHIKARIENAIKTCSVAEGADQVMKQTILTTGHRLYA